MNDQIDDEQFEAYLKSFHPLPPAPLSRRERRWSFVALSAAAAGMIVVLLLVFHFRRVPPALAELQPITIGSANKLLAHSSSWEAVIDDAGFAFGSYSANAAPGHRSTLEFLGQEDLSTK